MTEQFNLKSKHLLLVPIARVNYDASGTVCVSNH